MLTHAANQIDFYKGDHPNQYINGTEVVYSNGTARGGRHSNIPKGTGIVWVGMQLLLKEYVIDEWNNTFFNKPKEEVCGRFKRRLSIAMNVDFDVSRLEALHDLGYLPIHIKALPEGSYVPYGCPQFTIVNTLPEYFWTTNMLETVFQCELWQGICSATTYREYNRVFKEYAIKTGSDMDFVPFQAHDFSFRGMPGRQAAAKSAFACIAAGSKGTDTLPGIDIAHDYYGVPEDQFVAGSVPATEHSVMASGILILQRRMREMPKYAHLSDIELRGEAEYEFIKDLITIKYPSGNISLVCDTYDFWNVVENILPRLKDIIMARDGKLIIRPDSGDPVDILCGYAKHEVEEIDGLLFYIDRDSHMFVQDRKRILISEAQRKGLIECLFDTFGGTVTDKDYVVLDSHIGAIYGDSITLERQSKILQLLAAKTFASQNVVLGVGSYTYQYVTRDTHSIAMKATSVTVDGERIDVYKDPKTDDGGKKSAKGLFMIGWENGKYVPHFPVKENEETRGALQTVFKDGNLYNEVTLAHILAITQKSD